MNRKPTVAAIETAIKNADKMFGVYNYQPFETTGNIGIVKHRTQKGRQYLVDSRPGKEHCDCVQFEREGICKHQKFAADCIRIDEEAEAYEQGRDEYREAQIQASLR